MSTDEKKDQAPSRAEIQSLIDDLDNSDADVREMSRMMLAELTHHSFSTKGDWQEWWEHHCCQCEDGTTAESKTDAPQTIFPPTQPSLQEPVRCWLLNPSPLYSLFHLLMLRPEHGSNVLLKSVCAGEVRISGDRCVQIARIDPHGHSSVLAEWPLGAIDSIESKKVPKKHMFSLALMRWAQIAIGGGVLLDVAFSLYLLIACAGAPHLHKALLWAGVFAFGISTALGFVIGFLSNLVDAAVCRLVQFNIHPRDGDAVLFLTTSDKEDEAYNLMERAGLRVRKS